MLKLFFSPAKASRRAKLKFDSILSHWSGFAVLLTFVTVYYLFLLSNGTFQLFAPEMLDKAFGNMLTHLLRGEFTVDRQAIGHEAFTRDGKTYAYFGIFPALLRLFAVPFTDLARAELARLYCLASVVIFVALQLRMLLMIHYSLPVANRRPEYLVVMVAATVLSGPQLLILVSAMIYHEPVLWSAVMAAAFNLIVVRAAFGGGSLRNYDLVLLAAFAGMALNTRASIGVALYLGTILLVAWTVYAPDRATKQFSHQERRLPSTTLPPIAILGLAAVVVGIVNFERWGSAFTFANFNDYDMRLTAYPNLGDLLHKYGEFDVRRVWLGALYYATDIPYLLHTWPPFAKFLQARVQVIDGPPTTPILTNPLTIILAGIGLYCVAWKPELSAQSVAILRLALLGHAAAVILVFAWMGLCYRYRFDFAPFMTLAALIGYRSVSVAVTTARESWRRRVHVAAIGLCLLGILSSHYELLLEKVYSSAVPMDVRLALLPYAPFAHYVFHRERPTSRL
jgi:hypothetical protein